MVSSGANGRITESLDTSSLTKKCSETELLAAQNHQPRAKKAVNYLAETGRPPADVIGAAKGARASFVAWASAKA